METQTQTRENPIALMQSTHEKDSGNEKVYHTMYKKGHILGHIHFKFNGNLPLAVEAVKSFLEKKHLKHVYTVPFLVDIVNDIDSEILGL